MLAINEQIDLYGATLSNAICQHAFSLDISPDEPLTEDGDFLFVELLEKLDKKSPLRLFLNTLQALKETRTHPNEQESEKTLLQKLNREYYPDVICFLDEQSTALKQTQSLTAPFIEAFSTWLEFYQNKSPENEQAILNITPSAHATYRLEKARLRQAKANRMLNEADTAKRALTKFCAIAKKYQGSDYNLPQKTKERLLSQAAFFQQYLPYAWLRLKTIEDVSHPRCEEILMQASSLFNAIDNTIKHAHFIIKQSKQLRKTLIADIRDSKVSYDKTQRVLTNKDDQQLLLALDILSKEDGLDLLQHIIRQCLTHLQKPLTQLSNTEKSDLYFKSNLLLDLLPDSTHADIDSFNSALENTENTYEDLYQILQSLPNQVTDYIAQQNEIAIQLDKDLEKARSALVFDSQHISPHPHVEALLTIDDSLRALYGTPSIAFDNKSTEFVHLFQIYNILYKGAILLLEAKITNQSTLFLKAKRYYDIAKLGLHKHPSSHFPFLTSHINALISMYETHCDDTPTKQSQVATPSLLTLPPAVTEALRESTTIQSLLERMDQYKKSLSFPAIKNKEEILNALQHELYPRLLTEIADLECENELVPGNLFVLFYDALASFHRHLLDSISPDAWQKLDLMHFDAVLRQVQSNIARAQTVEEDKVGSLNHVKQLHEAITDKHFSVKDIQKRYLKAQKLLGAFDAKYHPQYLRVHTHERVPTLISAVNAIKEKLTQARLNSQKQIHIIKRLHARTKTKKTLSFKEMYQELVEQAAKISTDLLYFTDDFSKHLTQHLLDKEALVIEAALSAESPSITIREAIDAYKTSFLNHTLPLYDALDETLTLLNRRLLNLKVESNELEKAAIIDAIKLLQNETLSPDERKAQIDEMKAAPATSSLFQAKSQSSVNTTTLLSRLGLLSHHASKGSTESREQPRQSPSP